MTDARKSPLIEAEICIFIVLILQNAEVLIWCFCNNLKMQNRSRVGGLYNKRRQAGCSLPAPGPDVTQQDPFTLLGLDLKIDD